MYIIGISTTKKEIKNEIYNKKGGKSQSLPGAPQ